MRKKYRAELALEAQKISPDETRAAERARIDDEPTPLRRPPICVGSRAWFIDRGRWFEVEVVERKNSHVTIRPITGRDALHEAEWPYGDHLEFPTRSQLYKRLFPLSARRP